MKSKAKLPPAKTGGRNAFGETLVELGQENPDIWVLSADVIHVVGILPFVRAFPERHINVGIAEQTMLGMAAGLATCGKIPFVATFAFLISLRACEQVRSDIAYPNLNVKLFASHAGFAIATGGTTHHATEDIGIMRSIANMTILVPADPKASQQMVALAAATPGPVYLRLRRATAPEIYADDFDLEVGKANVLRDGGDVTLIGCGCTVNECLRAADELAKNGIRARVLDMHTIKPIDTTAIEAAAKETSLVITAEVHNVMAGLGGAVAEVMAELGTSTRLRRLGLQDTYGGIGPEPGLLEKHGLTGSKIAGEVVRNLI
jgi:transketolase